MTYTTAAGPAADGLESPRRWMSTRQTWAVFLGITACMLMGALDQTVLATAVWPIVRDLDPVHGLEQMPWVMTAYLLASTITQPLYGKLSDVYGAKRVFLVATGVFLVASALCSFAQSMGQLVAFRAMQGLGAGGLYSVSLIIMGAMVPPRERGRYAGLGGAVIGLSTLLGPLAGGFLTEAHHLFGFTTSWRLVFYLNLPLGVVALFLVAAMLHIPTARRERRIDYPGALLVMFGTSALLLMTEWGGRKYAWGSATIVGLGITAAVLLAAFLWWQARAPEPILPLRLFRHPVVAVATPMLFILGFALMGTILYISLYLQIASGLSPTSAGLHMLWMTCGFMFASVGAGTAVSKLGRYKIFPILGSSAATVALGLLGLLRADTSSWLFSGYIFLLGIGLGFLMQLLVLVVQNVVPASEIGTATTAATFIRTLGQAFGPAIFAAILTNRLAARLPGRAGGGSGEPSAATIRSLPPEVQHTVTEAFVNATNVVFLTAASCCRSSSRRWNCRTTTTRPIRTATSPW